MRKFLLVLLIILISAGSVFCGEFEDTLKKAEKGNASAQFRLGMMYYAGQGVTQNFKQTYVWFSLAAVQGDDIAIKNRDNTAKKLTPQQLSEAQELASQLYHKLNK